MITGTEQELRDYYAAIAAEYDDESRYPRERAAEVASLRAWVPTQFVGKRTLDVACGTGSWTACISQTAAGVVGVDINENMLTVARSRPLLGRADFVLGDAYCLSDDLGSFDAAFVGFWLSHVPRTRVARFLGSLHRRLKPRATVLIIDNSKTMGSNVPTIDRDDEGNTYQRRQLADGSTFRILKNFPSESELVAATAAVSEAPSFRNLEHFWTFQYTSRVAKVRA